MRRTYISSEFKNNTIYGTFNMVEESNFFGSKMMDVEDSILVDNQNLIYYQGVNGEQTDLSIESSLPSYVYSSSDDKNSNHTMVIDESQPTYQKENNTRWVVDIDLKTILDNYLFAVIKKYRTFEGMKTAMTRTKDVNTSIRKYITSNVNNRFKYKKIDFYIKYIDLRNQSVLKYSKKWNSDINTETYKFTKLQTEVAFDDSKLKITFNQAQPSSDYTIEYYFDILFEKI